MLRALGEHVQLPAAQARGGGHAQVRGGEQGDEEDLRDIKGDLLWVFVQIGDDSEYQLHNVDCLGQDCHSADERGGAGALGREARARAQERRPRGRAQVRDVEAPPVGPRGRAGLHNLEWVNWW